VFAEQNIIYKAKLSHTSIAGSILSRSSNNLNLCQIAVITTMLNYNSLPGLS
jgi:hypothetical protein